MKTITEQLKKTIAVFGICCFSLTVNLISHLSGIDTGSSAYASEGQKVTDKDVIMFLNDMGIDVIAVTGACDGTLNMVAKTSKGEKIVVVISEKGILGVLDDGVLSL